MIQANVLHSTVCWQIRQYVVCKDQSTRCITPETALQQWHL